MQKTLFYPHDARRPGSRVLAHLGFGLKDMGGGVNEGLKGGAYLAKPDSAKSESAVQERAKPYLAKPGN